MIDTTSKGPISSSGLDDVFNSLPQANTTGADESNKSGEDDDDWGGFETYEDPNDV